MPNNYTDKMDVRESEKALSSFSYIWKNAIRASRGLYQIILLLHEAGRENARGIVFLE